ncbi:MAG: hypothetical protein CK424_06215 [Legionella sp.]|nr:MAG: hypothetical protein CK424_06215 [Legionella sp.]
MNNPASAIIGWIGTGILGSAIVEQLLSKHFQVKIYNRTKNKCKPLVDQGAIQADSILDILHCETIFVCLGNEDAFQELILANAPYLDVTQKKITLIDLSTTSPDFAIDVSKRLQAFNISYLESPVSGGQEGAKNGTMTAICAGDLDVFGQAVILLKHFCSSVHYVGNNGDAQKLKIINNLAESINLHGASEVVSLGLKLGFDIDTLRAVLTTARGKSAYMDILLNRLAENIEHVAVTLDVRTKDLFLAHALLKQTELDLVLSKMTIDLFEATKKVFGAQADQTECFHHIQNKINTPIIIG